MPAHENRPVPLRTTGPLCLHMGSIQPRDRLDSRKTGAALRTGSISISRESTASFSQAGKKAIFGSRGGVTGHPTGSDNSADGSRSDTPYGPKNVGLSTSDRWLATRE